MGSDWPDLGSERPDLRSERPNLGSERPEMGSEWPDLGSKGLHFEGGDKQIGRRMRHRKREQKKFVLCGSIGHRPLLGSVLNPFHEINLAKSISYGP